MSISKNLFEQTNPTNHSNPPIIEPYELETKSKSPIQTLPLIFDIINKPISDDFDTNRQNKKRHIINKLKKPNMSDLIISKDKLIIDQIIELTSEKLAKMIYDSNNK